MDMFCSTYIALFDTQNLPQEYISHGNKHSVKMTFTSVKQLDYLLGKNWNIRKWYHQKDGETLANQMEIQFRTPLEVK